MFVYLSVSYTREVLSPFLSVGNARRPDNVRFSQESGLSKFNETLHKAWKLTVIQSNKIGLLKFFHCFKMATVCMMVATECQLLDVSDHGCWVWTIL